MSGLNVFRWWRKPEIIKPKGKDKVSMLIIDKEKWRSPNFSTRKRPIDAIILHHTGGSYPGCAYWLCNPDPRDKDGNKVGRVSAHVVIPPDGKVYQLVDDFHCAWHAGRGAFDVDGDGWISPVERDWNQRSLGVEIVAVGPGYKYTSHQLHTVEKYCYEKHFEYKINADLMLGHKEIAPGRKIDPANFNMKEFRLKMANMINV